MTQGIRDWLANLGLSEHSASFVENEIDMSILPDLTNEDLKDLRVDKLGHRKAILAAIRRLGDMQMGTPVGHSGAESSTTAGQPAERRQLTVLFCDLVGSTQLSGQLDPEELREVMRRYQDAVAGAVSRYGGHVAKYLGDGVLAYFGWPQAYEDQAERAVRAGQECVREVGTVTVAENQVLAARVGIATGNVVVGDLVGERGRDVGAVSGETPNLAARLQQLAATGQVVVDETTHDHIGHTFNMVDIGEHQLKGIDRLTGAWRIADETAAASRFEARRGAKVSEIVGRTTELQLLLDRWDLARDGEGQAIMISGEAGIGKSRLLQALQGRAEAAEHIRIRYQCSPYHANSALYPAARQLERAARFRAEDSADTRLDKLEILLGQADNDLVSDAPFFADLLGLLGQQRYGPLNLAPQQIRERLLEALINQLLALAAQQPVLFLFEDTHWIDPTSQELLERVLGRLRDARVLFVVTHRPEWRAPSAGHSHVTTLQLNGLAKAHAEAIVRTVAGRELDEDLIAQIVQRTDGTPLFIEELTKSLIEGGTSRGEEIPDTLQASLTERLDRLGPAKEVAQIGAVIGREFPRDLVAAIAGKSSAALDEAIESLVRSELVFRTGRASAEVLVFKHALVRDTAYESLLLASRREWHRGIAEALDTSGPDSFKTEPEVIAQHWLEAGDTGRAVPLLLRAGRSASTRSATKEAAAHFQRALQVFDALPSDQRSRAGELEILAPLGPALMNVRGFAHPEVGEILRRAYDVAVRSQSDEHLYLIAWNLWLHHHISGDLTGAIEWCDEVVRLAEASGEEEHLLQAHHAVWTTDMPRGRLAEAQARCDAGVAIYDPERHHQLTYSYGGHDAGACGHGQMGMALALQGKLDQGLHHGRKAVALAESLEHGPSLTIALAWLGMQHIIRRDPASSSPSMEAHALLEMFESGIAAVEKYGPPHFRPNSQCPLGWLKVTIGRKAEGLSDIETAIEFYRKTAATLRLPIFLFVLAEACIAMGDPARAIAAADEALEIVGDAGDRTFWPDLYRIKAVGMLRTSGAGSDTAEALFRRAIGTAQDQGAKLLELRAATGLARLMQSQNRSPEARDLLAPVYDTFTEGFGTDDLRSAREVLGRSV